MHSWRDKGGAFNYLLTVKMLTLEHSINVKQINVVEMLYKSAIAENLTLSTIILTFFVVKYH